MNIRKKDARVLLIKEGKKIIFEEGYENLTIKRLTTVCQMATGTFYNYFDNKKELVITIIVRAWDQMLGEIDAATALPMSLRDKIMIVNERFVKFATLYHPCLFTWVVNSRLTNMMTSAELGLKNCIAVSIGCCEKL
jgi:AcrR family transcriptional regulator